MMLSAGPPVYQSVIGKSGLIWTSCFSSSRLQTSASHLIVILLTQTQESSPSPNLTALLSSRMFVHLIPHDS